MNYHGLLYPVKIIQALILDICSLASLLSTWSICVIVPTHFTVALGKDWPVAFLKCCQAFV